MKNMLILGAAGRDFHNFNVFFRNQPDFHVVGFTAAQIPGIANRHYPAALAGPSYPDGIPIFPEHDLQNLLIEQGVDSVVFSYSDISHQSLMHLGRASPSGPKPIP
jgi:predicted GTPase